MKKHPLLIYFLLLAVLSATIVIIIKILGSKGLYFAQVYMLTPAIAAIITRLFFYKQKFSDAFLKIGKAKDWLKFWFVSAVIALFSYLIFSLLNSVSWDFSGNAFIEKISLQLSQNGQNINDTLPEGFTPKMMLILYLIGNLTVFNILPGLITGMGEEFGHRGFMFKVISAYNIKTALILGGIIWFLWHIPLGLVLPVNGNFSGIEIILNILLQTIGSVCMHIYLAYVLIKTKSIWITALAHITFNNVSTALGFFIIINNQITANAGLVITMILTIFIGFWKFNFRKTFANAFTE